MRQYHYFNILILVTCALAQLETLPTCAQNVILANTYLVTGCGSTSPPDYACYCKNVDFTTAVRLGIINGCSPNDESLAATSLQTLCAQYGVTYSPTATVLSTTSAPPAQTQTSMIISSSHVKTTSAQTETATISASGSPTASTQLITMTKTSSFTSVSTNTATVLGSTPSINPSQSSSSPLTVASSSSKATNVLATSTKIAIGCAVGIGVPVIVALSIYICCLKKSRRQGYGAHGTVGHGDGFVQNIDKEKTLGQEAIVRQEPVELDASRPPIIAELR